ncbi:MBL fold metallo-hydrolase [Hyphomonas johnsonii]|jgi:ribonuclease Z|uniref:Ribonuclease Z n=1 Tax=Hyphomonas johnsonii MHS-2 TaxID=1280950 RepID=A0A059FQS0_9PROT|nr:MBL fold metallo-hydrolase [Hyphomonas johnsonii]KCZ92813.1 ribonuclease Z [Hyphomonas johnsonii MHS-2]
MKIVRIGLIIGLALLLAVAVIRTAFAEQIGMALFKRVAERTISQDKLARLPDGLHVVLVGTGSPLADPTRAGPMTAVIAGDRIFVIDAGGGAVRKMQELGLPLNKVEATLLTHFHSDHIDGLGELILQAWGGGGRETPLPVYGPTGVEQVVSGLKESYAQDTVYRIAHHGPVVMNPSGQGATAMPFDASAGTVRVLDEDGLIITAVPVHHQPAEPAVGYRFDYAGRSVTISGDTARSESLIALARDSDILVHEALNTEMVGIIGADLAAVGSPKIAQIMADIPSYHTSPVDAASSAQEAGAKALVFTHIIPVLPSRALYPAFLKGTDKAFDGPIVLGEDGMVFSLPADGSKMKRSRLD